MKTLQHIVSCRINLIGAVVICFATSVTTVLLANLWGHSSAYFFAENSGAHNMPTSSSFVETDCGSLVYSPVQKECVEQAVFDAEMRRLFAALGLDTSIY